MAVNSGDFVILQDSSFGNPGDTRKGIGERNFRKVATVAELTASAGGGGLNADGTGTFTTTADVGANTFGYVGTGATIAATGTGSTAFGYGYGTENEIAANGRGSQAFGYAGTEGVIHANGAGSTARGYALGYTGYTQVYGIRALGPGSLATGMAYYGYITTTADSSGGIAAGYAQSGSLISEGGFVFGGVYNRDTYIKAGYAAMAVGRTTGGYMIAATATWAGGEANGNSTISTNIEPGGNPATDTGSGGSFAFGYTRNTGASIKTFGKGARAGGWTYQGAIEASGRGAEAHGYITGSHTIVAGERGAMAFGVATTTDIVASASGAVQFAEGTNLIANSVAVGADLRLHADGLPGTVRNGDIWVDGSGNVLIRSGGVSVTIA